MTRETSRTGTGAQRLPKLSKCTPKAFNFTPTSAQYNHNHVTEMALQYHHKNTHEDPTKDNLPNPWPDPSLYPSHHNFHLLCRAITHQDCILAGDLYNELYNTTYRRINDGQTQAQEGKIYPSISWGLIQGKHHPNTLNDHHMVAKTFGRIRKLHHLPRSNGLATDYKNKPD